jgi:hypothetical protein
VSNNREGPSEEQLSVLAAACDEALAGGEPNHFFPALRACPEFRQLLQELEAKQATPEPAPSPKSGG